ncbi:helix-turn-helix transcriptional regulator [Streptomyces sp. NPDC093252]|uniref:helix-turn-helix domain-containing protein n=1 Tax=Streptomyces sp. NPDC093252 TaxID=3154980 RepID=UPI003412DCFE
MEKTPAPGENIAVLRKARGMGRARLARLGGISVSLLTRIEEGTRPATPHIVAALAKAMRVTPARIHGQPFSDETRQAELLDDLRAAVRRYTLPREDVPPPEALAAGVQRAMALRAETRYLELLDLLPRLLGQVTATALSTPGESGVWSQLVDVYGCAYAAAHRLAQPDLADMIVSRQAWAAQQTWNPEAEVATAWNEAGTYQSAGQYGDGLAIVERAIAKYERAGGGESSPAAAMSLGSLHLRGVVLASRHKDKGATADHLRRAHHHARLVPADVLRHNLTFGPANTALYELAAHIELGKPGMAVEMSDPLLRNPPPSLTPSRLGRMYIDISRARLDVRNYSGAEEALDRAFAVAPEMAEAHPMAREVVRVLFVLHQRARPTLMGMAERTGLAT